MKKLALILAIVPNIVFADPPQCIPDCDKKLKVCEEVISECNNKVKELDQHIKILSIRISEQEEFIKKDEKYIDDLEAYAKKNDANSWWNRHKILIGFVGGIILTVGVGVGVAQVVK